MTVSTRVSSIFLCLAAFLAGLLILTAIDSNNASPRLLLLSSTVKDGELLASAANQSTIVVRYDAGSTTLGELLDLSRLALGGQNAASIAIAAHDYGVAKFYLTGEQTISLGSSLISEEQRDFWRQLGSLVQPDGRIDLLACDLAATEEGRKLVDIISGFSGVTVAASDDKTGNPAAGGDWTLETANVDVAPLYFATDRLARFAGLLVNETQKLTASDGATYDNFGISVAISGDCIVAGAIGDDDNGSVSGSAYVFRETAPDTWTEVAKLTASDGAAYDLLGWSVAIDGDRIVIGARDDDDNGLDSGSAYVFRETAPDTWTEVAKLTASDGATDDRFGSVVAIDGGRIVIGAYGDDLSRGAAYVFRETALDTWTEVTILAASDRASPGGGFGHSVAIQGDRMVIGAYWDDDNGRGSGSAYVFRETAPDLWGEVAKLTASDGANYDNFGISVAISGDCIVAGAPDDEDNGKDSGSAYLFLETDLDTWTEMAKLTASDGAANDVFGRSVVISGDRIVIGAYGDDLNGSVYLIKPRVMVNSSTGGITDKDGYSTVNWGSDLTITATPDAGWSFSHWRGNYFSGDNPLTLRNIASHFNITPVFIRDGGTLVVNIAANSSGGSYSISGPTDFNGGGTLTGLTSSFNVLMPTGAYTVTFEPRTGYDLAVSSTSFTVTGSQASGDITDGSTETISGVYTQRLGRLIVNIAANGSGGSYSISGPSSFNGGSPLTGQTGAFNADVPEGTYTVTFASVSGYDAVVASTSFAVNGSGTSGFLADGATETISGEYIVSRGSLRVTLIGTNKGGWKLQGQVAWRPSGNTQSGIPAGSHTVVFKPVTGFQTPEPKETTVVSGVLTDMTAIYVEENVDTGGVLVASPNGEAPADAGWRPLLGGSVPAGNAGWFAFGETVPGLPEGEVEIEFKPAIGHIIPVRQMITIKEGKQVRVSAQYLRPFIVAAADYNGDGLIDPAVYDPDMRVWSFDYGTAGGAAPAQECRFGVDGCIPAPADYDGDGITDLAYCSPDDGYWRVKKQFTLKNFGEAGDIPVPGDYLGIGFDQPAIFRPGEGLWLIWDGDETISVSFGTTYDIPVPADYNGDDIIDLGVYDIRTGRWRVALKRGETTWKARARLGAKNFGEPGDIPVPADYDGDGLADIAVYSPGSQVWSLNTMEEGVFKFGRSGDIPIPADWDGDGAADIAIFRERNGTWATIDGLKVRHGIGRLPLCTSAR